MGEPIDHRIEPGAVVAPVRHAGSGLQPVADERRKRRHARREQLYCGRSRGHDLIRRVGRKLPIQGALAGSAGQWIYDHGGPVDGFRGHHPPARRHGGADCAEREARFAIIGPTVYWRMDAAPAPTRGRPRPASQPENPPVQAPVAEAPATLSAGPVRVAIRHDRLEADEVAAFRFA